MNLSHPEQTIPLHFYSKEEWWDVCRKVKPELTWAQYEVLWSEFQQRKEAAKPQ